MTPSMCISSFEPYSSPKMGNTIYRQLMRKMMCDWTVAI